jgi:hypothetical protein
VVCVKVYSLLEEPETIKREGMAGAACELLALVALLPDSTDHMALRLLKLASAPDREHIPPLIAQAASLARTTHNSPALVRAIASSHVSAHLASAMGNGTFRMWVWQQQSSRRPSLF